MKINLYKGNKVFYKYILSYFLIFLIPFIFIGGIMYYNSVNTLKTEIEKFNMYKLSDAMDKTDKMIQQINISAVNIINDNELKEEDFTSGKYSTVRAMEKLNEYKRTIDFVDEIVIYFNNDENVYSTFGMCSLDVFINNIYGFQNINTNQFKAKYMNLTEDMVFPAQKVNFHNDDNPIRIITYVKPIKTFDNTKGEIFFIMREEVVSSLNTQTLGSFEGLTAIINDDGNIMAKTEKNVHMSEEDIHSNIKNFKDRNITNVIHENKKYSLVGLESKLNDWKYIVLMPEQQFFQRVIEVRKLIFLILSICFIIGIIAVAYLSVSTYKPLYYLRKYVLSVFDTENKNGKEDLELIRECVDISVNENIKLYQKITTQLPFVREQFLIKLLKGKVKNIEELERIKSNANVDFKYSDFYVVIACLKNVEKRKIFAEDKFPLIKNESGYDVFGLQMIENDSVCFIINSKKEITDNYSVENIVSKIREHISEVNVDIFGVGSVYSDVLKINSSFIEACTVKNRIFSDNQSVIFFNEISNEESAIRIPEYMMLKLLESMQQGDIEVGNEAFSEILEYIKLNITTYEVYTLLINDILNSIIKLTDELNITSEFLDDYNSVLSSKLEKDAQKRIYVIIDKVCKTVIHRKNKNNNNLYKKIIKCIYDNIHEPSLNQYVVAEQLNISPNFVANYFKQNMEVTFHQYLGELRFENIKKMLCETDKKIQQIVKENGYIDIANFTRKFKKAEGVTMTQYRKLHRQSETKGSNAYDI